MKISNTMVSVILIGAVLVLAYALGLVIRQVRTGSSPAAPAAAGATDPAAQRPGTGPAKDTPAERAQAKEMKAKMLEKMDAATKEEREQFTDKVIKQAGGRRGGQGSGGLTPEERQARKMKAQQAKAAGEKQDANSPAPSKESTDPKQSAEKAGVTP